MNYTQKRPVFAYEPCLSEGWCAKRVVFAHGAVSLEEYGYAYVELLAVDGCVVADQLAYIEAGTAF